MTTLDYFNEVVSGPWENTHDFVSWKIENRVMYFQPSKQAIDWARNFDQRPTVRVIGGVRMIIPHGPALAWDSIADEVRHADVDKFVGYSHGSYLASYAGADTGRHAICFGSPGVAIMTPRVRDAFWCVDFLSVDRDIVTYVMPPYEHGKYHERMKSNVTRPDGISCLVHATGHGTYMYRSCLQGRENEC